MIEPQRRGVRGERQGIQMIKAAEIVDIQKDSGDWVFVDMGFAKSGNKSCGLAVNDENPICLTYSDLASKISELLTQNSRPLNLLIEAPLSIAFDIRGNPTDRSIEKRGSTTRYWYVGLGCSVLVGATFLLHKLSKSSNRRPIRLIEGFASFKDKDKSSHIDDVSMLRNVVWNRPSQFGQIIHPDNLKMSPTDCIPSAVVASDMDLGIPPVVMLEARA